MLGSSRRIGVVRSYPRKSQIIREDDPADHLYEVISGAVDNNQLKVFSETTVRKAAGVRHSQQRYQRAPKDNPQFAVL